MINICDMHTIIDFVGGAIIIIEFYLLISMWVRK